MITADQLKEVISRTEALHRYLDIDAKKMEYEEEQLRTQDPDFWSDQKAAEAQMKKVKEWKSGSMAIRRCRHSPMSCSSLSTSSKKRW